MLKNRGDGDWNVFRCRPTIHHVRVIIIGSIKTCVPFVGYQHLHIPSGAMDWLGYRPTGSFCTSSPRRERLKGHKISVHKTGQSAPAANTHRCIRVCRRNWGGGMGVCIAKEYYHQLACSSNTRKRYVKEQEKDEWSMVLYNNIFQYDHCVIDAIVLSIRSPIFNIFYFCTPR